MDNSDILHELRRTEALLAKLSDGRMKAMGMECVDPRDVDIPTSS